MSRSAIFVLVLLVLSTYIVEEGKRFGGSVASEPPLMPLPPSFRALCARLFTNSMVADPFKALFGYW